MTDNYQYLLSKMQKFCSYQERCIVDVRLKLQRLKVQETVIEKIIDKLQKEDYVNEERYALIYAGSKLRLNKWGKNKIIVELQKKRIPDIYIQIGLGNIDDEEYLNTLKTLLSKKDATLNEENPEKRKEKLAQYAITKGYNHHLVWQVISGEFK